MDLASLPWVFQFNMRNEAGETVERSVAFHQGVTHWRYDNQVTGEVRYFRAKRDGDTRADEFVEVDVAGEVLSSSDPQKMNVADWPPASERPRNEANP